jgi:3-oxoacyl-[acyl-carrier-protein] synthase-3
LRSDGIGREFLKIEAGGSILPTSQETLDNKQHFVFQDGKTVFKYAVSGMADVSEKIMQRNNLSNDDVNWLIAHQANKRIIDATSSRMGLDESKVLINIERKLKKGDNLIFAAFGGGFTWGAIYLKWAYDKK